MTSGAFPNVMSSVVMKRILPASWFLVACFVMGAFVCGRPACMDASCASWSCDPEFAWWGCASESRVPHELSGHDAGQDEPGSRGTWKLSKRCRTTFKVLQLVPLMDTDSVVCVPSEHCARPTAVSLQSLSCLFRTAGFSRLYQHT